jgi:hypothetical protein
MKYFLSWISVCIFLASLTGCTTKKPQETAFYVSLSGNDSWSDRLAEPNSKGTDGPFKTIEKARDAVREMKKSGTLPEKGATVFITDTSRNSDITS